jgi:predicted AAA+ superfamily ATPase
MIFERLVKQRLSGSLSRNKVRLIFGARQVGKTVLLKQLLPPRASILFNLQDSSLRRRFEQDPAAFSREVRALPRQVTHLGVDEIQKVPALLEEVQDVVDTAPGRFQIFLTGSSSRRLRTRSANLLPGRCHVHNLYPVVRSEEKGYEKAVVGPGGVARRGFAGRSLEGRLRFGNLPGIAAEPPETAAATLDAYVSNYLEEEIRKEALVRDVGAFSSFLRLAGAESGAQVNLAGLSRESGISASTIKTFYQVLVDTFVGYWMPPYRRTARKRLLTTPRFYLFDLGVRNAVVGLPVGSDLLPATGGPMLEHWVALELIHRALYAGRGHAVSFWRTTSGAEVDFVWESPGEDIPIEVKWTDRPRPEDARHVETFLELHQARAQRGLLVCRAPRAQQLTDRTLALPWLEL